MNERYTFRAGVNNLSNKSILPGDQGDIPDQTYSHPMHVIFIARLESKFKPASIDVKNCNKGFWHIE